MKRDKLDLCDGDNAVIWQRLVTCVGNEDRQIIEALLSVDENVSQIAYEVVMLFYHDLSYATQQHIIELLGTRSLEREKQ
jgi:hypothetical protein